MAASTRLAEHEAEGHDEELVTLIVADMQDPVTPILKVALAHERLHDAVCVIARLDKIVHHGAAVIDEDLPGVGAVKIHLGHVVPPLKCGWRGSEDAGEGIGERRIDRGHRRIAFVQISCRHSHDSGTVERSISSSAIEASKLIHV